MKFKNVMIAAPLILGASLGVAAPANAVDTATWDALAQCESGGNWNTNTGNGFYGGVQFTQQSWNGVGMSGSPHGASKEAQIEAAERLLAQQGWGAWPACSAQLGLSGRSGAAPSYQSQPVQVQQQAPVVEQPAVQAPVNSAPVQSQAPVVQEAPATTSTVPEYTTTPPEAPVAPVTPGTASSAPVYQTQVPEASVTPSVPSYSTYKVQAGDTLSKVAHRLNIPGGWEALWNANRDTVSNPNLIFVGQTLNIPAS